MNDVIIIDLENPKYWYLEGKTPKPVDNIFKWAENFEKDRRVAEAYIGDVYVSTVFLGFDHSFGDGPPLLFETMIFGGQYDGYQGRTSTWDEAIECHVEAVSRVADSPLAVDWWIVGPILVWLGIVWLVAG